MWWIHEAQDLWVPFFLASSSWFPNEMEQLAPATCPCSLPYLGDCIGPHRYTANCLSLSSHKSRLCWGMSLDWLCIVWRWHWITYLVPGVCLQGFVRPEGASFCQESGESEEVSSVKYKAAIATKIYQLHLCRPFTTDFCLSSLSWFLSWPIVLPRNKWYNISKRMKKWSRWCVVTNSFYARHSPGDKILACPVYLKYRRLPWGKGQGPSGPGACSSAVVRFLQHFTWFAPLHQIPDHLKCILASTQLTFLSIEAGNLLSQISRNRWCRSYYFFHVCSCRLPSLPVMGWVRREEGPLWACPG